jgi:hypothetical protein
MFNHRIDLSLNAREGNDMNLQRCILAALILMTLLAASPAAATLTVYTDRNAWVASLGGNVVTEDFSGDPAGNYQTPFATVEDATFRALSGGPITIQVIDSGLFNGSRELHFRDFSAGVGVALPNSGRAFGFDYGTAIESWTVQVGNRATVLPAQSKGFVGYVDDSGPISSFILKGAGGAQGGISLDNLSRAGVRFGGLPHAALGQAQLQKAPDGSLVVSNLGSSGEDGVAIHVGEAERFTTETVLDPAATQVGGSLKIESLGTIDGQRGQPMGSLAFQKTSATGYTALVDYSDLGASTYTARFYDSRGVTVYEAHGLHSGAVANMGITISIPIKISCTFKPFRCTVTIDIPIIINFFTASFGQQSTPVTFAVHSMVFEPETPTRIPTWVNDIHVMGTGVPELHLTGEAVSAGGLDHHALNGASLTSAGGDLTVSGFSPSGDAGFASELGLADTVDLTFNPIDPGGNAPVGASVTAQAFGSVRGRPDQPLGQVQVTKMADGFQVTPDFTSIDSPTHHLQIYDHGSLVADLPGQSGPAGIASAWPRRFGKLGGALECYVFHWPQDITWRIGGPTRASGPAYSGDEVRVLAEAGAGAVDFKSGFQVKAAKLDSLTLTDTAADPAVCHPSSTRLCLSGGRFGIETSWQTVDGQRGVGQAIPLTADTGYFWFFQNTNVEMVIKVLNACGYNGRFWVFSGGLTDVMVTMKVTDAQTGLVQTYVNPQKKPFQPLQDVSAFGTCTAESIAAVTGATLPAPKAAEAGVEAPEGDLEAVFTAARTQASSAALLLNQGRFRVEATWATVDGKQGTGQAVQLTSDTGYFWFFDSGNVEMVVKVLNGCGYNQRFWVFAGGLTDVAVSLKVTDTATGLSKTYLNAQKKPFQPIQDVGAFGACN